MNLVINQYRVECGKKFGFDLYETKEVKVKKDGAETGETKLSESWVGFYGNPQSVADKLFWLELKASDASTLEEVLSVVRDTKELIELAGWTGESK